MIARRSRTQPGAATRIALCALLAGTVLSVAPAPANAAVRWQGEATVAGRDAGWGRLARMTDGRWLAVTTRFHRDAPTTLAISISDDRARTWRPLSALVEPGRKLDNGELLVMPDGRVLLAMRSLIDGVSYRLNLYASGDAARTWRLLTTIDRNETPRGRTDRGLWEPMLARLSDGTLSVLYADETLAGGTPSYSQVISQRLSRDGGASWGPKSSIVAQAGGGHLRPGMPVMAQLRDGGYLLVFEICGEDRRCPVAAKRSADGRQWPAGLGSPVPGQYCGPHVLATTHGPVFVTSCQNEVGWSADGGQRWQRVPRPAWPLGFRHSWPALYQFGPGEIGIVNVAGPGAVRIRFGTLETAAR